MRDVDADLADEQADTQTVAAINIGVDLRGFLARLAEAQDLNSRVELGTHHATACPAELSRTTAYITATRKPTNLCSLSAVQMEDEAEVERLVAARDAARSQCTNVLRRNLASASTAERLAGRVAERDARLAQLAAAVAEAPESDAAEAKDMDAWRHAFYRDIGAQMETTNRLMQELLASIQEEVGLHRQHADLLQQGPVAIGRAAAERLQAPARTELRARVEHWLALLRQWSAMTDAIVRLPPAEDLAQLVESVRQRQRLIECDVVNERTR